MASLTWRDATSYQQDEKPDPTTKKVMPRVWEIRIGTYLRVCVTKHHRDFPNEWIMHCHPLFTDRVLNLPSVATPEAAQLRALDVVRDVVNEAALVLG